MSLIYLKVFKCEYKQYITFHIQYTFIQKQTQFTNTKKIKTLSNKTIFIKGHLYSKLLFKIFFKDENILLHWVSILMIWTFYIANQRLWISILLSVLKNKKTFFFSIGINVFVKKYTNSVLSMTRLSNYVKCLQTGR